MTRKTPVYSIPSSSLTEAASTISRYLQRITLDSYDYRTLSWFFPEMSLAGQQYFIGGAPSSLPTRNRRFIELSLVMNGTGSSSSVRATLYSGGATSTDRIFRITATGTGWQRAVANISDTTSLLNAGKESLDRTTPWGILLENLGGFNAATNITLECLYEDFIDYLSRGVSTS